MGSQEICYTRDVALEKAIEVEQQSFDMYHKAYKLTKDKQARDLIRELALEELEHKHTLEKAFFEETVALHGKDYDRGPTMKLTLLIQDKPLDESSSPQDVLAHAIFDEKRTVDFYQKMAGQCSGAPMAELFARLARDENAHLARLEELYERVYMQEM